MHAGVIVRRVCCVFSTPLVARAGTLTGGGITASVRRRAPCSTAGMLPSKRPRATDCNVLTD
eukprot:2037030-Pyramimonas_sp.AAC.1